MREMLRTALLALIVSLLFVRRKQSLNNAPVQNYKDSLKSLHIRNNERVFAVNKMLPTPLGSIESSTLQYIIQFYN